MANQADIQHVHLLGNLISFKGRGTATGNSFSLVDMRSAPGAGTPPHRQKDEEAFYVLEGTYEIMLDGQIYTGKPGDFFYVKPGQPHAFKNNGDQPARMLIINLPGGTHESFFADAGDEVADVTTFPPAGAPDLPRLGAASARHGIELLL